jgi:hypothetical protein
MGPATSELLPIDQANKDPENVGATNCFREYVDHGI